MMPTPQMQYGSAPAQHTPLVHRLVIWAILAATFAVYAPTLHFQFVYDDKSQVVENPRVHSWRFLPQYFGQHVWAHISRIQPSFYRPLFLVWLRVNHAAFGVHPGAWHLATLAIHLTATGLVYLMLLRLLRDGTSAAFGAAFFGLHPVHVEAVAWVSGATEPLGAVCLLGVVLAFLKMREGGALSARWLVGSLLTYGAGLLVKESAVVLLPSLGVLRWIVDRERATGRARAERVLQDLMPFLGITVLYLLLRVVIFGGLAARTANLSLSSLLFTWPWLVWYYIRTLLWPGRMAPFHDSPVFQDPTLHTLGVPLAALFVLAAIGGLGWILLARRDRAAPVACPIDNIPSRSGLAVFSCSWIVLPLLPVLNLNVLEPGNYIHDRYLYLPSIGLATLVSLLCRELEFPKPGLRRMALSLLVLSLLAVLAVATGRGIRPWSDELSLYAHSYRIAPNNLVVKNNLATALIDHNRCAEAIPLLEDVVARNPNFWMAYANIAGCYIKSADLSKAEAYLARAAQVYPDPEVLAELNAVRQQLGR